jgi:hypothetical protein
MNTLKQAAKLRARVLKLKSDGLRHFEIVRKLRISACYVSNILHGKYKPKPPTPPIKIIPFRTLADSVDKARKIVEAYDLLKIEGLL